MAYSGFSRISFLYYKIAEQTAQSIALTLRIFLILEAVCLTILEDLQLSGVSDGWQTIMASHDPEKDGYECLVKTKLQQHSY